MSAPEYPTCDQCASGEYPIARVIEDANICQGCVDQYERALVAAAAHIVDVQARCGCRLAQVDASVPTSTFGPVALVDVSLLVRDAVEAFLQAERDDVPDDTSGEVCAP